MQHFCEEARRYAYATGVKELAPLVQRLIDAEGTIRQLSARIESLEAAVRESTPAHLRTVEKRKS